MTAAVDAAYRAALTDVATLWSTPGATDVESVTQAAVAAVVHSLATAGVLQEPAPQKEPMTVEDAARRLAQLGQSARLPDPEEDWPDLIARADLVTYAWTQAQANGIPPSELNDAHEARRLLLAHHRSI